MRHPILHLGAILALVVAPALPGCGGSSSSSPDNRPTLTITTPSPVPPGVVAINFDLSQRSGQAADILPEYSTDGGNTYQRSHDASGTAVVGLSTSPTPGENHDYLWDTVADGVGLTGPVTVTFLITPYLRSAGLAGTTDPFTVDNSSAVALSGITPEWGPVGTSVTITGQGFGPLPTDNVVTFGDVGGTGITRDAFSVGAGQITVVVPDPTPQPLRDLSGPITVTVFGQSSNAVQFVAVDPIPTAQTTTIRPTSREGNSVPWWTGGNASVKVHMIYRSGEIGSAGVIDTLRWATTTGLTPGGNDRTLTISSVRVRMAHTSLETPTHIQAINFNVDPPRQVALIPNYTIPPFARGFFDLPLSADFPYNGRDNLLIEIESIGSSGAYFWNVGRRAEERRAWEFTSGARWRDIILPAVELGFRETDTNDSYATVLAAFFSIDPTGAPCTPPAQPGDPLNCPFSDGVFPTGGSRMQALFLTHEITGTGTLKGIAWKPPAFESSVAASYTNLKVSVGLTQSNFLSAAFQAGLTQVRAPGSYDVPAGEDGFIPIPLDQPGFFLYDGTENLVVEITTDAGTALNPADSADLWRTQEQRLVSAASPTAPVGTVQTSIISLRLEFE